MQFILKVTDYYIYFKYHLQFNLLSYNDVMPICRAISEFTKEN